MAENQSSKKKVLIICLIVVLAVAAGAGSAIYFYMNYDPPDLYKIINANEINQVLAENGSMYITQDDQNITLYYEKNGDHIIIIFDSSATGYQYQFIYYNGEMYYNENETLYYLYEPDELRTGSMGGINMHVNFINSMKNAQGYDFKSGNQILVSTGTGKENDIAYFYNKNSFLLERVTLGAGSGYDAPYNFTYREKKSFPEEVINFSQQDKVTVTLIEGTQIKEISVPKGIKFMARFIEQVELYTDIDGENLYDKNEIVMDNLTLYVKARN